jgi:hypothetical protein
MSNEQEKRKGETALGWAICGCFVVGIAGIIESFIFPLGFSLIASAIAFGIVVLAYIR